MGDSGFATNTEYRGFLSFDASALRAPGLEIERGEVRLEIPLVRGNPFGQLGALLIEGVHFAALGRDAFVDTQAQALGSFTPLPVSPVIWSADVADALREPENGLTQFRLRFASGTDLNGVSDHILGRMDTLELLVDYRIP